MFPKDWMHIEQWWKDTYTLRAHPWPLEQRQIKLYGKTYDQPRLTAWYGLAYTYSGVRHPERPLPDILQEVAKSIEQEMCLTTPFNSVLVNYYRDGNDSVDWHADDEREIDQSASIASVSVGAARTFQVRPKGFQGAIASIPLQDGDLLVMPPGAQATFAHRIPKTKKPRGPRWNFTFRRLL